ncbi:MAG: hypothetical protein V1790_04175, partial [Planctomycetota bacterium]
MNVRGRLEENLAHGAFEVKVRAGCSRSFYDRAWKPGITERRLQRRWIFHSAIFWILNDVTIFS